MQHHLDHYVEPSRWGPFRPIDRKNTSFRLIWALTESFFCGGSSRQPRKKIITPLSQNMIRPSLFVCVYLHTISRSAPTRKMRRTLAALSELIRLLESLFQIENIARFRFECAFAACLPQASDCAWRKNLIFAHLPVRSLEDFRKSHSS